MLEDTINSLLACRRSDAFTADVIVVDNASTDGTSHRLQPFVERGDIRLLYESRPGLSFARNTGVQAATGRWIIFLDDDVLVPADFLVRYAAAMQEYPSAAFFAGAVLPVFDAPIPQWVSEVLSDHSWCFSAKDLGETTHELEGDQFPYGANMAIRRDIALQFPFQTALGFKHGTLVPGEETELFRAVAAAGFSGMWLADVPVRHRLPPYRASRTYLLRRAFGQGRADAVAAAASGADTRWVVPECFRLTLTLPYFLAFKWSTTSVSASVLWLRRLGHVLGMMQTRLRS
jgi:hypothetical protein